MPARSGKKSKSDKSGRKAKAPQRPPSRSLPSPSPATATEGGEHGRQTTRREVLLGVGLAGAGAALGIGGTYWMSARQEVRAQTAVKQDEENKAAAKGPLGVSAVYRRAVEDPIGWAFPSPLPARWAGELSGHPTDVLRPDEWFASAGGVRVTTVGPAGPPCSRIRITMRGQWVRTVLVKEIRVRVRRQAPLAGALVWAGSQGGGPVIDVGVDLDESHPVVRTRDDQERLGAPYTDKQQLTVAPDEVVTVDLLAQTTRGYCEWDLGFVLDVDGKEVSHVVDDGGAPFRTTAFASHYDQRYFYELDQEPRGWWAAGPGGRDR